MNSLSTQGTTLLENGVVSTMNRRESSDPNGARASTFSEQFSTLHSKASAQKAEAPSHDSARGDKDTDNQASNNQNAPRPIVESLTVLRLSRMQKAVQNNQPAKKNKLDESAASGTTGGDVANSAMSTLSPEQISLLVQGLAGASAIMSSGDAGAQSGSDTTTPSIEPANPTAQGLLATLFPEAATQALSGKSSFLDAAAPAEGAATKDTAKSASDAAEASTLIAPDPANISILEPSIQVSPTLDTTAPKRMTLDSFLAQLPAALTQAISEKTAFSKGAHPAAMNTVDGSKPSALVSTTSSLLIASSPVPLGSDVMKTNVSAAPTKLTLMSFATHLPAAQLPALAMEGAAAGDASSMNAPPSFSHTNAEIQDPKEKSLSAANDAFVQQLELQGGATAAAPISSPSSGGSSGSVTQTTAPAPSNAISDNAKDSPSKILTFHLEPEDLGAVTVRMQLTKTRVSLRIDVNSPAVQKTLTQSRDQLSQALSVSGHSVDDIAIRVSPAPVPSATVNDAPQNESQASFDQRGEGGSFGGNDSTGNNRDGQTFSRSPRKDGSQEQGGTRSGGNPGASGVYL
ncbi:flagellar hook-length control protein FliK [Methylocystis sp. MJC1]|jgi:hypothetical protein|uniref:flagellar hook-length control protein FliK n=1 Tax=Methylocystis sp. MJC1 TaxID=2654282 RepID=UPI0013EC48BF|nr:flagellar hook-length control protein FliK [Methylocystis sp. MJC1]KAF2990647.1 hypothetical protein MJC1_02410 [Methylocystis sp. MJC1]MBU6525691.1 flagellar hook-length control protein FliK [Methylocystis sp. MJC1]UZX12163.1 flagellar hook-length control protein FliK [Methylocystis sp. MJC1]